MAATNAKVTVLLRQYAAALTVQGADRFKVKAYLRAAAMLETSDQDVGRLVARGADLQELPGVGKAISSAIQEILRTRRMPQLDKAMSTLSPELVELSSRPG